MELPIVTREHFNRWYSLRAYYTALTLADAPIQAACILIYTVITYVMTAQPMEFFRFGLFFGIITMTAFVAQSLGLVVGALFDVKVMVAEWWHWLVFTDQTMLYGLNRNAFSATCLREHLLFLIFSACESATWRINPHVSILGGALSVSISQRARFVWLCVAQRSDKAHRTACLLSPPRPCSVVCVHAPAVC